MPTYAYACTDCGHRFDIVQSFHDDALTECPECEGRLRKVFNSVGVVFKGSGFYKTDSRSEGKAKSAPAGKGAGGSAAKESTANGSSGSGGSGTAAAAAASKASGANGSSGSATAGSSSSTGAGAARVSSTA
ncbi:MAG TPA: zinc ribbon domain-containing protein [Phycicoccus sp.]|nr:zinc ribbon domain-containing protein [Phycicoccus sp.]